MTAKDAAGRFRLASTALVLGAVVLVLTGAGLPLGDLAHQLGSFDASEVVVALSFAAVGVVVAWHQPRNPIGWILLGSAGFFAINDDASFYMVADYRLHHGALPLGPEGYTPGWCC